MYVADLMLASNDDKAAQRVFVADEYGLSLYYFTDQERQTLLASVSNGTTLKECLCLRMEAKLAAKKFHLCTSHDLAPVISTHFSLPRGLHKSKTLRKKIKKWAQDHPYGDFVLRNIADHLFVLFLPFLDKSVVLTRLQRTLMTSSNLIW